MSRSHFEMPGLCSVSYRTSGSESVTAERIRFRTTSGGSRIVTRDFTCGSDFDIFDVGSVKDITRAAVSGM